MHLAVAAALLAKGLAAGAGWVLLCACVLPIAARYAPWSSRRAWRARVVAAYLVTLALYRGVAWITPALGTPLADARLLGWDRALFGESPAIAWGDPSPAAAELMSAAYFSYHLYLHGTLALVLLGDAERARRVSAFLFSCFAAGLAGYLLVPAMGPIASVPGVEFVQGGAITAFNTWFTTRGSSVYDVFPSLHVLISGALLWLDARTSWRRAAVLAPIVALLWCSTLVLRYHYAVDVVASVLILACAVGLDQWWRVRSDGGGHDAHS